MNVLMVLTSHDALGATGKKTGFWLEEFAAPYYVLSDAGAKIDERQPSWPVPTTTLAGGAERKTGLPVWRAAPPA